MTIVSPVVVAELADFMPSKRKKFKIVDPGVPTTIEIRACDQRPALVVSRSAFIDTALCTNELQEMHAAKALSYCLSENRPWRGGQAHFAPRAPQNEPVPAGSRIGS